MNLAQLDKIIGFAKQQVEFWRGNTPYMNDANVLISVTGERPFTIELVNLYNLTTRVIKPAKAIDDVLLETHCSMLQLLCLMAQRPHWWANARLTSTRFWRGTLTLGS
jgi:hypothetical protein